MPKPKKKANTFAEIAREYGLSEGAIKAGPSGLRYRIPIERGILWYWFSKYIRKRDAKLMCISCGDKPGEQAGHFIPTHLGSWDDMVFNEENVHGECPNCNDRDKRKLKYRIHLEIRLPGAADNLEFLYQAGKQAPPRNWGKEMLRSKIAHYRSLVEKEQGHSS